MHREPIAAAGDGLGSQARQAPQPMNPTTPTEFVRAFYKYMSPKILTMLAVGLIGFRIYLGNWRPADLVAPPCILLFWPVMEWLIHAHLLHMKPFSLS